MIWFTLALFVVSFIITALLAPKPDFENARASTLDDATFPRATENAPIPLVLGRVRMQGPNTIWYGDFQTEALTDKVKTGLFSSETVIVGYKYFLGMDLALALGPNVALREIWIDDELAHSLDTTGVEETFFEIEQPLLFGGRGNGGGFVSSCAFYNGSFTQTVNAYVEGQVGTGGVPAYLGTSHLVFAGAEIGESINLRKMAFTIEQYTNVLLTDGDGKVNSGLDINPAEALYQLMIDTWYGLGIDPVDIDIPSLQAAGNTLFAESNGCSIIVTSESDSKRLIDEILRQIDGIMYQDTVSGKLVLELIRDDYVFANLPIFDEADIIEVKSFTKTTWDEVRGQVKVSFPQRDNESEAVAVSQDMAVVATTGKLKTTTLGFPFLYDKDLANRIASRERAQISVPLFRATLEVNRNANTLRPGSVFRFDWPDYGISDLVMRVQRFDLGALLKGQIVIEAIQDNFALATVVFQSPQDSDWENVVYGPTPIVAKRIIQTPRFMTNKLENVIEAANYGVTPLALDPASASIAYSLHVLEPGEVLGEGSIQPRDIGYRGSGLLTLAYSRTEGFVTGQDTTVGLSLNSVSGRLNSILTGSIVNDYANLIIINDEIMAFRTATDNGSNNWALTEVYRGLLGTQVADHAMGDRMYSIPVGAFGLGAIDYLTGADYDLRVLDVASGITEDAASVTAETVNISAALNVNDKPLRVNNLELDGVRVLDPTIVDKTALDLTWNPRDFNVLPIPFETDPAETPTFNESYDIDVRVGGVTNATLSGTVAAGVTTYSVPFDLTAIDNTDVEIRVTSIDEDNSETGLFYSWYLLNLAQVALGPSVADTGARATTGAGTDTTLDVAYPTTNDGELIVLTVFTRTVLTPPSGWTLVHRRDGDQGDLFSNDVYVWVIKADGTEAGNLTLTVSGTSRIMAQMSSVTADNGIPFMTRNIDGIGSSSGTWDTGQLDIIADATLAWIVMSNQGTNGSDTVTVEAGYTQLTPITALTDNRLHIATIEEGAAYTDAAVVWTNDIGLTNFTWSFGFINNPIDFDMVGDSDTGVLYRFTADLNFTDAGLTTPVAITGDAIHTSVDVLGNDNMIQTGSTLRPTWRSDTNAARFDGANDRLVSTTAANNSAGTLIARVRSEIASGSTTVIIGAQTGSNRTWISCTNGVPSMGLGTNGSDGFTDVLEIESATDFHVVAGTWDATDQFLYVDGIEVNTQTRASIVSTAALSIGTRGTDLFWDGDISEVMYIDRTLTVEEIADIIRYWNFLHDDNKDTDPAFFTDVNFLAGFNGADGATTYTEESDVAAVCTFVGNADLRDTEPRFGTTCLDVQGGSGTYATFPDSAEYDFTLGVDKSIRVWYKWTGGGGTSFDTIVSKYLTTGDQRSWGIWINEGAVDVTFAYSLTGTNTLTRVAGEIPGSPQSDGNWHEIAVTYRGADNRYTVWFDGTPIASEIHASVPFSGTADLAFGGILPASSGADLQGLIDECRISDNLDIGASYVPREAEFPRTGASSPTDIDPPFVDVNFLAGFNGANNDTSYTEESDNLAVATFTGTADLDSADPKFGTTAAFSADTGTSRIEFPQSTEYDFTNGNDKTIRVWFNSLISASTTREAIISKASATSAVSWYIGINDSAGVNGGDNVSFAWTVAGNSTFIRISADVGTVQDDGNWHELALTYEGATDEYTLYFDGTAVVSLVSDTVPFPLSSVMTFGTVATSQNSNFEGYIDEVRISDFLEITGDYTPRTSEFPRS